MHASPLRNIAGSASLLDSAIGYAARGWPVLPLHAIVEGRCTCNKSCRSPGKHPRTRSGLKDASTDPGVINRWWTQWPDANIGIATGKQSNLVVLDVDPDHGGKASLDDLTASYSEFETLSQVTGGKGWHYFFEYPESLEAIKNSAGKIGKGLDIRADGGYVVAPPSTHSSGNLYQWETEIPLSNIPGWLLFLIAEDYSNVIDDPEYILEGSRNNHLASIGGKLRNDGKKGKELEIALLEENRLKCRPPLDDSEVSGVAQSISRYHAKPKPLLFVWRELLLSVNGPRSSTTRHVLLTLATHMDKKGGSCFPTIGQLSDETRLSRRVVGVHLQVANEDGWLDIYEHFGKGQAWRNHGYIATLPNKVVTESNHVIKKVVTLRTPTMHESNSSTS